MENPQTMRRTLLPLMATCPFLAMGQPGMPDTQFNGNGIVSVNFGPGSIDVAWDVAFQSDGKAVIAGLTGQGNQDFAVVRLNPDGSMDNTFGGGGKTTTEVAGANDRGRAVAIQADGKIVVVGHARLGGSDDFAVVRYLADGTLDNTFDGDGRAVTDIDGEDRALAVAIQPDGKIMACGISDNSTNVRFRLFRYNGDGSPDLGFGGGTGTAVAAFLPEDNATAWDLALQPDGKIVVAGYANNGTYNDVAVARFNNDGSLDSGFGSGGLVVVPVASADDLGHAVELQPDGKIVVAGYAQDDQGEEHFIGVRLLPDGTLDNGFDGDGVVSIQALSYGQAYGVVVQPDGFLVLAGHSHNGTQRVFSSVRCSATGTLDPDYDGDGMMSLPVGTYGECYGATLAPDGGIALVGYAEGNNSSDFALVKVLSGLNLGVVDPRSDAQVALIHPNPVVDRTRLSFDLLRTAPFDLVLVDEQGRTVRTYFTGRLFPAGNNQVEMDLAGLPSGAYTLVLNGGSTSRSVRLVKQ